VPIVRKLVSPGVLPKAPGGVRNVTLSNGIGSSEPPHYLSGGPAIRREAGERASSEKPHPLGENFSKAARLGPSRLDRVSQNRSNQPTAD
jgi:hypothetical protein